MARLGQAGWGRMWVALGLWAAAGLVLGGCPKKKRAGDTPAALGSTATIGAAGGAVATAAGAASLRLPAGALVADAEVSIEVIEDLPVASGPLRMLAPLVEITITPAPVAPLDQPAMLSFGHGAGAEPRWIARRMAMPGSVIEGEAAKVAAFWRPLRHSRLNQDGRISVWLARFSGYGAGEGSGAGLSLPPAMLVQPATPEGMTYVGRLVVVDSVCVEELSTVPDTWSASPDQAVIVYSDTVVTDGTATSDVVVAHVFAPAAAPATCAVDPELLAAPAPQTGYVYVGYDVVVNAVLADSSIPLDYVEKPEDLHVMRSETEVEGGTTVCDVIVRHLFALAACTVPTDLLAQPETPDGFVYIGYDVVVDAVLVESTVPFDYVDKPEDVNVVSSDTVMSGGVIVCDVIVRHLFAPIDCQIPAEWMEQPETPEGFVYVGYDVTINFVLEDTTIPLDYVDKPEDISVVHSETTVIGSVAICDMIVRHLFVPIDCEIPAEWMAQPETPEGFVYVGYDVTINSVVEDTTIPLDYVEKPEDHNVVHSETTVIGSVTICDMIVRHLFAPTACPVPEALLAKPETPEGFVYVGYDLTINAVLTGSTVPLDYEEKAEDVSVVSSETQMEGEEVICDFVVRHLFVPTTCPVPEALLTKPETPEGFGYRGYDVVVNAVLTETTIPLDYEEQPEDVSMISSQTEMVGAVIICDIVVRHLFVPSACDPVCADTETCTEGACETTCGSDTCEGCCKGGACDAGDTEAACGAGGAVCELCAEGSTCEEGVCIRIEDGLRVCAAACSNEDDCRDGQVCRAAAGCWVKP